MKEKEVPSEFIKDVNETVQTKAVDLMVEEILDMLMAVENKATEVELRMKVEKVNRGIWWESGADKDLYWKNCYRLFVDSCGNYYLAAGVEKDTHPKDARRLEWD